MAYQRGNEAHVLWPTIIYLPCVVLFMSVAAGVYWPLPELAFRSDSSPVSWLSSAQLWAMAVLSIRLTGERALPFVQGLWLAFSMAAMAFDEQFMFHEQWKFGCERWFEVCRFLWIRELPMLMVGFGGVATALWLHLTMRNWSGRLQLWTAIGIGVFALSMDLLHVASEIAAYEEAFEVIAEAIFLSFLLGLRPFNNV